MLVLLGDLGAVALLPDGHVSRDHRQPVAGFEGEVGLGFDGVSGYQGEVEALGDHRDYKRGLHRREVDADTLPGAAAEREVGVAGATLGPLGVKRPGSNFSGFSQNAGWRWVT